MLAQMSCSESDPEGKLLARQRSHLLDLELFLIRPITPHSSGHLIGPADDPSLSFPKRNARFSLSNPGAR